MARKLTSRSATPAASAAEPHVFQPGRLRPRPSGLALAMAWAAMAALAPAHAAPEHVSAAALQDEAEASVPAQSHGAFWQEHRASPAKTSLSGAAPSIKPSKFRASTLDRHGLSAHLSAAPMERSPAAQLSSLEVALPHPDGGYQRFALVESPVMEAGLAAKHPEIKTYAGKGIDDPRASLRMDITPLGLHASVRTPRGAWYVDPYYHLDDSLYVSYHRRDLPNTRAPLIEGALNEAHLDLTRGFYHAGDSVEVRGFGFVPGATVTLTVRNPEIDSLARQTLTVQADRDGAVQARLKAEPSRNLGAYEVSASDGRTSATASYHVVDDSQSPTASSGQQLRTYRLALVTDPNYANYFGGSANVTAAKATLVNRITHIYEDETAIRLVLVNDNDKLNLDTPALMTGANGPCGATACYTSSQAAGCGGGTLTRNRTVVGLLIGASNFDVGHIGFGLNGGGLASLGVVGGSAKAQGCTGVPTPVGDLFAVDYVAHEIGHQFAGNHTFNGVSGSCTGGNRNAGTSVEPGSGSSIMAYAGICGSDDTQPHSDAYWSQRSFDEIMAYTSGAESTLNETQQAALTGFAGTARFQLSYDGSSSVPIVRGSNYTVSGIKAAIEGLSSWPAGGTVTVSSVSDAGFTLVFGGSLAGVNVKPLSLQGCTEGCKGFVGEIVAGGPTLRRGSLSATGNTAPLVSAPNVYTIPLRTPFALTGTATDADGDTLTYMWEQNDRGGNSGTSLVSNNKTDGPLFRQFGVAAQVSEANTILYNSPGANQVGKEPTRVFPDMAQILANNTNAETGQCPAASTTPTIKEVECFSEFLPTAAYVGAAGVNASPTSLNFKLTARDGKGGVNSATTQLILAPGTGPFLVTSPNTALTLNAGAVHAVTWNVAGTQAAPINTSAVKISLSVDGGLSFPHVLAASTPNDGSHEVRMPALGSSKARIKIEAVDNVFFDVSNVDFTLKLPFDPNGDAKIDCADLAIVKASMGKRTGQPRFDPRADVNKDGVVDLRDLSAVSRLLPLDSTCTK